MTRTKNTVAIPRSWFERWHDPKAFFCTAWGQIKPLVGSALPQHLRDAYVAGLFSRIWNYHSNCEVRLPIEREQFPDAQLREGKHTIDLEIVTADKSARRTYQEHREVLEKYRRGEFIPTDCPEKRRDDALEAIPKAVLREWSYRFNRRNLPDGLDGYLIRRAVECATITYDQLTAGILPDGANRIRRSPAPVAQPALAG